MVCEYYGGKLDFFKSSEFYTKYIKKIRVFNSNSYIDYSPSIDYSQSLEFIEVKDFKPRIEKVSDFFINELNLIFFNIDSYAIGGIVARRYICAYMLEGNQTYLFDKTGLPLGIVFMGNENVKMLTADELKRLFGVYLLRAI